MQIPAAKTRCCTLFFSVLIALIGLSASAQDNAPARPAPPAVETKPPPAPKAEAPEAVAPNKSSTAAGLDYLYNRKPQEGTAAKQVADANLRTRDRTMAAEALGVKRLDDPAIRARFEKYLALPEVSQEQLNAYNANMAKVLALLRQGNVFEARKQLYALATFGTIDAGVSQELGNRVESIWNADRSSQQIQQNNERLRDDIKTKSRNADMLAEAVRNKEVEYRQRINPYRNANQQQQRRAQAQPAQPAGDQPTSPTDLNKAGGIVNSPSVDSVIGKLELTNAYMQTIESGARIKLNELKSQQLFDQTKTAFSDYIATLFKSGRQRHVILAADFYRRIFNASEYPAVVAQQVTASLETARDVANAIEVVKSKIDDHEIAVATEQMQTAFLTNEFDPSILGLNRIYKKKVEKFCGALTKMQNLIEAREFTELEVLLASIKEIAPDFDATKAKAIVNAVKLEGQLRLGKAKLAAQQGDLKQAMEEFQAAAEAWPNNPDLKDKALTFFDSQDIQSQSLREFDRLVKEGNYRGIFDKQLAFAPAMKDDKERQEHFKNALEKVKIAEMATEKANLMRANGDVCGAWETVELAVIELPTDIKLNTLRGELAGKGAEFVEALNRAKEAETRKELGYSLTWYAVAQRQYPASRIANQAIERLSQEILAEANL